MKIKLTSIKEKIKLIICLILKFVFRKTKVQLPFFEPMLSTLHNSVATELVMATNPSARNQILNQCTNICCKKAFLEGYTGFCASVVDSTPAKFENLKTFPVDLTYTSFAEMKMIIKRMLDNGLYIFFNGIDDYYIPGKTFYGKKHRNHDGVFTGYDETDKTYTIAAYNSDWVLSNFKIPQKSFFLSVKKALERGYTPFIRGLLAKDGETEINIQAIIVGLQKYIDENNKQSDKLVYGIEVYDYFSKYAEKLLSGEIKHANMDWRCLRTFWEFRVCMLERIRTIESQLDLGDEISEKYAPIVEETNELRMQYAIYHKKQRDTLLSNIKDELLKLKDKEIEIIKEFIKQTLERNEHGTV